MSLRWWERILLKTPSWLIAFIIYFGCFAIALLVVNLK